MGKQMRLILSIMIGLLALPLLAVKADLPDMCHTLVTAYDVLTSQWRWLDADTVIFSVSPGHVPDAISRNPIVWYEYHPSTDELIELKINPYIDLLETSIPADILHTTQRDDSGVSSWVSVSPDGQGFVYTRIDTTPPKYWYRNLQTGLELDLGDVIADIPVTALWSADSQQFVVYSDNPSTIVKLQFVSIDGTQFRIQDVAKIAPPSLYYGEWVALWMMGFSSDGQYILLKHQMSNEAWLLTSGSEQLDTLHFALYGDRVVWLNDTTFVALTNLGVIEYDIQNRAMKIRPTTHLVPSFNGNLSPDGRFMMGRYAVYSERSNEKLLVCRVG